MQHLQLRADTARLKFHLDSRRLGEERVWGAEFRRNEAKSGLSEGNVIEMLRQRAFDGVPLCVAMTILQHCSNVKVCLVLQSQLACAALSSDPALQTPPPLLL